VTRRTRRSWVPLVFVVLAGGGPGGVVGEGGSAVLPLSFLAPAVGAGPGPSPPLGPRFRGFSPGFTVRLNLAVLLGVVFALWLWRWV